MSGKQRSELISRIFAGSRLRDAFFPRGGFAASLYLVASGFPPTQKLGRGFWNYRSEEKLYHRGEKIYHCRLVCFPVYIPPDRVHRRVWICTHVFSTRFCGLPKGDLTNGRRLAPGFSPLQHNPPPGPRVRAGAAAPPTAPRHPDTPPRLRASLRGRAADPAGLGRLLLRRAGCGGSAGQAGICRN